MKRIALLVALGFLSSASTASASLLGVTANLEFHYDLDALGSGGTDFTGAAVVGPGTEFSFPICSDCKGGQTGFQEGRINVDIGANTVTFAQTGSPFPDVLMFNLLLTGLNSAAGPIIAVTPVTIGNPFNVSFTGNSITIVNPNNFDAPSNFTNTYQVEFGGAAVPEPSTMLLVGGGMLVGAVRRRMSVRRAPRA